MAKLNRERKVRERRAEKAAKKDARKQEAIDGPSQIGDPVGAATPDADSPDPSQADL